MIGRHLNLIRKIVWGYVKTSPGLEFDDLFSEACLAFLDAQRKYDASKSEESTFVWYVVHNQLKTLLGREGQRHSKIQYVPEISTTTPTTSAGPEQLMIAEENWKAFMGGLSPEAKFICSVVLNDVTMYLPTDKPKSCKSAIIRSLKSKGWKPARINAGFREIKQALYST